MSNNKIVVATDGSALGNPGPAGWAWYVNDNCWAAGGNLHATNNLMEIQAVREFLSATKDAGLSNVPVEIQADSQYVINALTKWIHGWKKRGWTTAGKKPVANREIFEDTFNLMQGRNITFVWIKGHNGHVLNEAADRRAKLAAERAKNQKSADLFGPEHITKKEA